MQGSALRSDAGVLDILFAVALGEGFITGMYEYKDLLISGEVFTFADPGQGLYRILLTFLIIILSWIHFRSDTLTNDEYPRGEFVVDILVVLSYMTLFLFVEAPTIYFATVSVIWLLYALARYLSGRTSLACTVFGLAFVMLFLIISISSAKWHGNAAEWSRLVLLTIGIVIYRPLDRRLVAQYSNSGRGDP